MRAVILTLALWLALPHAACFGQEHGSASSLGVQHADRAQPGSDADAGFDRATALAISQAAVGRTLTDYNFMDSHAIARRLASYRGKPLVISLIYTSCFHVCPTTTKHLARVVANARTVLGSDSFAVVSVGFDTQNDSAAAMRVFAREQNIDVANWDFLASDAATMQSLAEALGFQFMAAGGGFNHLLQTTLLDGNGRVARQVYGMDFDPPQLIEPLKALVFGIAPQSSFFDELSNRIRLFCTVYDAASDSYRFDFSILVGLLIGIVMGVVFVVVLIREWRYSNAQQRRL